MVYEQGIVVDSIESNVEQTSVFVSQGTENLRKASGYKVSIFICLVIIVLNKIKISISEQNEEE